MKSRHSIRPWQIPLRRVLSSPGMLLALLMSGALLLAGLQFYEPFYFTHDDNAVGYLSQQVYNYRSLVQQGEFPFCNFHQYLGNAYYHIGSTGIFYWPAYVAAFLADKIFDNILTTIEVNVSLHLLGALMAMYAYLRITKIPPRASIYGALFYLTCPFWLCGSKDWAVTAYSAFYIPALLACLEAWLRRGGVRYLLVSSVLKIGFIYQGNVQFLFIYQAGEMLYLACRLAQEKRQGVLHQIGSYLASNFITVVAAAPLMVPMFFAMQETAHRSEGLSIVEAISLAVEPQIWIGTLFFHFKGEEIFKSDTALFYLGGLIVFPLLLTQLCVNAGGGNRRWIAPFCLFVVALFLSTRLNVILHWIPPFDRMRWPFKWYMLCSFGYTAAATIVLQLLHRRQLLSTLAFHGFFLLAIGSNLLVVFSPRSQVAFATYHLTPAVKMNPEPRLLDGRSVAYPVKWFDTEEAMIEARTFNFPSLFGDYGFAGYDPLVTNKVNDAVLGLNHHAAFNAFLAPRYLDRLSRWSVRYFLTIDEPKRKEELRAAGFHYLITTKTGLVIFENPMARPFAWFDGAEQSVPVHFDVNSAKMETGGQAGHLTISLIRLPGWQYAFDGGSPRDLVSENADGQMQVEVPPNVQTVTVSYFPPLLRESLIATVLFLLLLVPFWIWFERAGHRRISPAFEERIITRLQQFLAKRLPSHPKIRTPEQTAILVRRLKRWTIVAFCVWLGLIGIYLVRLKCAPPLKKAPVELRFALI